MASDDPLPWFFTPALSPKGEWLLKGLLLITSAVIYRSGAASATTIIFSPLEQLLLVTDSPVTESTHAP